MAGATATLTALRQRAAGVPHDLVQPGAVRGAGQRCRSPRPRWLDITVWGGVLIITGYSMGTLYEHKAHTAFRAARDLSRRADDPPALHREGRVHGEPLLPRLGVRGDGLRRASTSRSIAIEDMRAAALLHDIGKLDVSRELLYKAARLTKEEYEQMQQHVDEGRRDARAGRRLAAPRDPDRARASRQVRWLRLPPERAARTSRSRRASSRSPTSTIRSRATGPYRKAMSPFEAKDIIAKGSRHRLRPARRRRVPGRLPPRRTGSTDGCRLMLRQCQHRALSNCR